MITQKTIVPTLLFFTLSPGSYQQAILYLILYRVYAAITGIILTPADIVVTSTLFILINTFGFKDKASNTLLFISVFLSLRKLFPQYY